MRYTLLLLSLLLYCMGCKYKNSNHQKTVTEYYSAFDSRDFQKIHHLISDQITLVSGDFTTPYSKDRFYTFYKWDSVFQTNYDLIHLERIDDHIKATVSLSSIRNEYLNNNAMTCAYNIYFDEDKISKIEELDCTNVNWADWQSERDTLVDWIKIHHPELDGFINDMTKKGAQNYLKAIEYYRKAH